MLQAKQIPAPEPATPTVATRRSGWRAPARRPARRTNCRVGGGAGPEDAPGAGGHHEGGQGWPWRVCGCRGRRGKAGAKFIKPGDRLLPEPHSSPARACCPLERKRERRKRSIPLAARREGLCEADTQAVISVILPISRGSISWRSLQTTAPTKVQVVQGERACQVRLPGTTVTSVGAVVDELRQDTSIKTARSGTIMSKS